MLLSLYFIFTLHWRVLTSVIRPGEKDVRVGKEETKLSLFKD